MARDKSPDLFANAAREIRAQGAPLAERMRPRSLAEYLGQTEILGPGKILRRLLDGFERQGPGPANGSPLRRAPALPSLILWGPPGTGKTTLALLIARAAGAHFVTFSAVSSGVKEAREAIEAARQRLNFEGLRTILFVDEIHRFNKAQQDAFLPAVEEGTLALLGATTENPSFELNSALLSRCRVFVLRQLPPEEIGQLLERALADEQRGLGGRGIVLEPAAREALAVLCGGDARGALNALELAALTAPPRESAPGPGGAGGPGAAGRPDGVEDPGSAGGAGRVVERVIGRELALEALQRNTILYDQSGEEHHNLISAFQKSIRHSDPDAALYYLARMIAGGEDPLYIARRLVRTASEDVGLADPQALLQALAAKQAAEFLGYPECDTALAQATLYLAAAPKSNALEVAILAAKAEVQASGPLPVPMALRNAPTALLKQLGYHDGYQYDHDWPEKISPMEALPEALVGRRFYQPGTLGFEKEIRKRLEYFERVRARLRAQVPPESRDE